MWLKLETHTDTDQLADSEILSKDGCHVLDLLLAVTLPLLLVLAAADDDDVVLPL